LVAVVELLLIQTLLLVVAVVVPVQMVATQLHHLPATAVWEYFQLYQDQTLDTLVVAVAVVDLDLLLDMAHLQLEAQMEPLALMWLRLLL
jgi:hypothetical protein